MKIKRKIIEIDEQLCSGCGECAAACAEGAIRIVGGKARLVSETFCDGLGACLGDCPEGALKIIERESEEFDPKLVEEHLRSMSPPGKEEAALACGCPSQQVQIFPSSPLTRSAGQEMPQSALTHWPVQIRLVPPQAPFLKGADLLVAADCTPLAYAGFHQDLLPGKVVMLGCPKFDDAEEYTEKFAEIFRTAGIRSITVVEMEVPCCSKLPLIIKKALGLSDKRIPMEEIVISRRGEKQVHGKEEKKPGAMAG
jgi:ferredoxin